MTEVERKKGARRAEERWVTQEVTAAALPPFCVLRSESDGFRPTRWSKLRNCTN